MISKTFGGSLIVAGTAIGAGMLALPITTGVGGFFPASTLIILCFSFMLATLFLLLEANLYTKGHDANIISMCRERLGYTGRTAAWISFLMVLYAASAAYISGGGALVVNYARYAHLPPPTLAQGSMLFAFVFGFLAYLGVQLIDYLNRFLMIGLMITYFFLIYIIAPHVQMTHLADSHPLYLLAAVPVIVLSFTSHIVLPSLRNYLNDNLRALKRCLIIGSILPLIFYLVWEFLLTGILPNHGPGSLMMIGQSEHPLSALSANLTHNLGLAHIAIGNDLFSFFAMVTSFLGVVLSLTDFLADGLHVKKTPSGRAWLMLISFVPPLIFALYYPTGFVLALGYAGVFVAILFGILPVLMVWRARYHDKLIVEYTLPGGKPMLVIIFMLSLAIIGLQIAAAQGWLPAPTGM